MKRRTTIGMELPAFWTGAPAARQLHAALPWFHAAGAVLLYGAAALVTGVVDILFCIRLETHTGFAPTLSLLSGILSVMSGVMLLVYPDAGQWILSLLFPIWFLAHCISQLSRLFLVRLYAGRGTYVLTLILDCLGIMLGVAMFFSPGFSLAAAGALIGSYLLCLGGGSVVWGIEFLRKSSEE